MSDSTGDPAPDADKRRFELAVWPQTQARPWHAEVCVAGEAGSLRFERPIDLLLFLTRLPGTSPTTPRGLR